jgi:hypothetical protein
LLLVSTLVVVNVSIVVTLLLVGYRSDAYLLGRSLNWDLTAAVAAVLVVAVLVASAGAVGTQMRYERDVNAAVETVLDRPAYERVSLAGVSTPYAGPLLFERSNNVTVTIERPVGRSYPALPDRLVTRIETRTGSRIRLRVIHVTYATSSTSRTPPHPRHVRSSVLG